MTLAPSRPLHELAEFAPTVAPGMPDLVAFPFANDDSVESFQVAMARTETPEYQAARNRVAIVVGESALSTSIRYIPEETIIVVDDHEGMVRYMTGYGRNLQTADDLDAWKAEMGLSNNAVLSERTRRWYQKGLTEQIRWWEHEGEPHALHHPEVFAASRAAAAEKAIIPWLGDITSLEDMTRLGNALRKLDATVTLVNLSNVIPFSFGREDVRSFPDASGYAEVLAQLPITSSAPILTTSLYGPPEFDVVDSTGPYFGLDQLRLGGNSETGPVAMQPDDSETEQRLIPPHLFELLRRQRRAARGRAQGEGDPTTDE